MSKRHLPENVLSKINAAISRIDTTFRRYRAEIETGSIRTIIEVKCVVEGVKCIIEYVHYKSPCGLKKPSSNLIIRVDGRSYKTTSATDRKIAMRIKSKLKEVYHAD